MSTQYHSPWGKRNLIYVYSVPTVPDHAGCLKVGMTNYDGPESAAELPPNCDLLKKVAKSRIHQQTNTAAIPFDLQHVELAVREKHDPKTGKTTLVSFRDKTVHAVLEKSGFHHCHFKGDVNAYEWFKTDLATVLNALDAVKKGHARLRDTSFVFEPIKFRPEQEEAINKTCNRFLKDGQFNMLWDAKMRFGKTLCALEVVKRCNYKKTIIITHRPAVQDGWTTDFDKIFFAPHPMELIDKSGDGDAESSDTQEQAKRATLRKFLKDDKPFIYFASVQDLRGSQRVGGKFKKNDCLFDIDWDLVIIDEAHEGTQTELGQDVTHELIKTNTHHLALSGTPFNILSQYEDDSTFVWDYIMEQEAKAHWNDEHPGEENPYGGLPRLNICTFNLSREFAHLQDSEDLEGKAFNFTEFFRTLTGLPGVDDRELRTNESIGDFVRPHDVDKFLDLLSKKSTTSNYPFSTDAYREFFRHTLWMVPGVKEGAALKKRLEAHPFFKSFGIANVAGCDEDAAQFESALTQVRDTIANNNHSITISCGKLTTGVTVPEWTAVLMLAGSVNTSASSYMQTIFRVQSPGEWDGRRKEECYVFDFAPDRTLTVLADVAQIKVSRTKKKEKTTSRIALERFLNYCPVISIDGAIAKPIDTNAMMKSLKRVFINRAIRNGFDDRSLYSDKLLNLQDVDFKKFDTLKKIVGSTRPTEPQTDVPVNDNGLDQEDWERETEVDPNNNGKKPLSPEEIQKRKEAAERRRQRDKAISILRAISIRMPLLIYGANKDLNETISLKDFIEIVDDDSWVEFMPRGVTKELFREYIPYYDRDVFEEAGRRIRLLAKHADDAIPTQRIQSITHLFSYFKNPDKETVLTPWRVVNMHLSDTLGGWCFFDESFNEKEPLDAPRHVLKKTITPTVFSTYSKVLEINSKSGLYPLYMAYSIYRTRLGSVREETISPRECQRLWRLTLEENLFVLCKTPMAASITRRTLMGYGDTSCVHAKAWKGDLVATLKNNLKNFTQTISRGTFWNQKDKSMTFDTIVGNPPYQLEGHGKKPLPIYHYFVNAAMALKPNYVSMITPSRWFATDDIKDFRAALIKNGGLAVIHDFPNAGYCFPTVEIKGGVSYFRLDKGYSGKCEFYLHDEKETRKTERDLQATNDIIFRDNRVEDILKKVQSLKEQSFATIISPNDPFGFDKRQDHSSKRVAVKFEKEPFDGAIKFYYNGWRKDGIGYVKPSQVSRRPEWVKKIKVLIPKAWGTGNPKRDRLNPFVVGGNTVCTETYLVVGPCKSQNEAKNIVSYIDTDFFHFMVSLVKITQNSMQGNYRFVPLQDFSEGWDDEKLYAKYGITAAERKFIEEMIRPMA